MRSRYAITVCTVRVLWDVGIRAIGRRYCYFATAVWIDTNEIFDDTKIAMFWYNAVVKVCIRTSAILIWNVWCRNFCVKIYNRFLSIVTDFFRTLFRKDCNAVSDLKIRVAYYFRQLLVFRVRFETTECNLVLRYILHSNFICNDINFLTINNMGFSFLLLLLHLLNCLALVIVIFQHKHSLGFKYSINIHSIVKINEII